MLRMYSESAVLRLDKNHIYTQTEKLIPGYNDW